MQTRRFWDMRPPNDTTRLRLPSFRNGFVLICLFVTGIASEPVVAFQSQEQLEVHARQLMIRGLTFMRTGYPDKAAAVFSEGLETHPQNSALLSAMVDAQMSLNDLEKASFYMSQALEQDPSNLFLLKQAFSMAITLGDAENAMRWSADILAADGNNPAAHLSHLNLLFRLQQWDQAMEAAQTSIGLFPSYEPILRRSADIFLSSGELEKAKNMLERIAQVTRNPDDLYRVGTTLSQLNQNEDASLVFAEVLRLDDEHPGALAALGHHVDPDPVAAEPDAAGYLFELGQFEELDSLSTARIETDPRQLDMWVFALKARLELKKFDSVIELAEEGLLLFPGYSPLLLGYARGLFQLGRPNEALRAAESALSSASQNPDLQAEIQSFLDQLNINRNP